MVHRSKTSIVRSICLDGLSDLRYDRLIRPLHSPLLAKLTSSSAYTTLASLASSCRASGTQAGMCRALGGPRLSARQLEEQCTLMTSVAVLEWDLSVLRSN